MHLEGKVAIVTGASRGIGRAVAINLAQSGTDAAMFQRFMASSMPRMRERALASLARGARTSLEMTEA